MAGKSSKTGKPSNKSILIGIAVALAVLAAVIWFISYNVNVLSWE